MSAMFTGLAVVFGACILAYVTGTVLADYLNGITPRTRWLRIRLGIWSRWHYRHYQR